MSAFKHIHSRKQLCLCDGEHHREQHWDLMCISILCSQVLEDPAALKCWIRGEALCTQGMVTVGQRGLGPERVQKCSWNPDFCSTISVASAGLQAGQSLAQCPVICCWLGCFMFYFITVYFGLYAECNQPEKWEDRLHLFLRAEINSEVKCPEVTTWSRMWGYSLLFLVLCLNQMALKGSTRRQLYWAENEGNVLVSKEGRGVALVQITSGTL